MSQGDALRRIRLVIGLVASATLTAALATPAGCAARDVASTPSPSSGSAVLVAPEPGRVVTVHGALGCLFEMSVTGMDEADARRLLSQTADEIDHVEDALGGWRDDTDLARLNAQAATHPFAAPPLLFDTLATALELGRATDGAFDVTLAPLVDAYGLRHGEARVPPADELARLRACVGPEHLRLDPGARTIAFDRPGVAIDLDGLNKGVAVDRVIATLRAGGVTDASISAGGSTIGSIGPPPEQPPRLVAIEGPDGEVHARVELRDAVLSTSGNWRNFIVVDGHTYGAIFDPRSGAPVEGDVVSATVVASRGDESEAYAKAGVVLGPSGAERLARERGLRFVLLLRDPAQSDRIVVSRFGE